MDRITYWTNRAAALRRIGHDELAISAERRARALARINRAYGWASKWGNAAYEQDPPCPEMLARYERALDRAYELDTRS